MYQGSRVSGEFKKSALEKLKDNWPIAILTCFIYSIITGVFSRDLSSVDNLVNKYFPSVSFFNFYRTILSKISSLINFHNLILLIIIFVIEGPLLLGISRFFLKLVRKENPEIKDLFFAFTNFEYFINALLLSLLTSVFIFLWLLLLIIPGIIAALKYSMAPYIMSDNPAISPMEALKKSKDLMEGNKSRFFTLQLSFIGWDILCILTLGIARIFVLPYANTAYAEFYEELAIWYK